MPINKPPSRVPRGRADRNDFKFEGVAGSISRVPRGARGSKQGDRRRSADGAKVASRAGARIETGQPERGHHHPIVASRAGARIETPIAVGHNARTVSRPARARGSKQVPRGRSRPARPSRPARARGSIRDLRAENDGACQSRPARARGSKHAPAYRRRATTPVASRAGARNETRQQHE